MSLRRRIVDAINLSLKKPNTLGDAALKAFCELPGADMWQPERIWVLELNYVFDHGLPLALLAQNNTADRYRKEVAAALFQNTIFPASRWSEIHTCALLTHWGLKPRFIEETKTKTPDLEILLHGGTIVDVEVARAEVRQEHRAAYDRLAELAGALRPSDIEGDLLLILQDASNVTDVNELFEASYHLRPGESAEREGRWFACAVQTGEMGVSNESTEALAPAWWAGRPCLRTNSILMDGTNQVKPTVLSFSQPPPACYQGPITRKANSGQGRSGHPYLIAVDMTEVLGWQKQVDNYIAENFPIWRHVSGVLAFERRFWSWPSAEKLYLSKMYINEHAQFPLPQQLARLGGNNRQDLFELLDKLSPRPD